MNKCDCLPHSSTLCPEIYGFRFGKSLPTVSKLTKAQNWSFLMTVLESCKDRYQALTGVSHLEDGSRQRLEWSDVYGKAATCFAHFPRHSDVASSTVNWSLQRVHLVTNCRMCQVQWIELIATTFREPLEAVGVNLLVLQLRPNHRGSGICTKLPIAIETEAYHKV